VLIRTTSKVASAFESRGGRWLRPSLAQQPSTSPV